MKSVSVKVRTYTKNFALIDRMPNNMTRASSNGSVVSKIQCEHSQRERCMSCLYQNFNIIIRANVSDDKNDYTYLWRDIDTMCDALGIASCMTNDLVRHSIRVRVRDHVNQKEYSETKKVIRTFAQVRTFAQELVHSLMVEARRKELE